VLLGGVSREARPADVVPDRVLTGVGDSGCDEGWEMEMLNGEEQVEVVEKGWIR
jgi:hypothetical protein